MKPKTRYILKREDRDGNIIDVKLYKESEIRKIYLSEKKDMRSKGYIIQTRGPVWKGCWTEVYKVLNAGYTIYYYYVKGTPHRPLVSNKKNTSKYFYTVAKLEEGVALQ